jgi:alpha-1,6-mannosyltransferase
MVAVMTAQPTSPVGSRISPPAPVPPPTPVERVPRSRARLGWRARLGDPPRGPLLLGLAASLLMVVGGVGAGGVLVHDPLLTNTALGFWRYGHGRDMAGALVYVGVALLGWAWVRLGREVIAGRVRGRAVLVTAGVWVAPMLVAPPLFTRDVYSYLAQGALPLVGFDPYAVGPEAMPGTLTDNVHFFWQDTPAPYGPLFILIAKAMAAAAGENMIAAVLLMRLALLPGLLLLVWALPELTRRLGGRVPVALWVAVANPVMVIHLVGGAHNDLLVVGMLAAGALLALRGRPVAGVAIVSAAMAVKATAGLALPFLVLVWAGQMQGARWARIVKAGTAGLAVFAVVFGALTLAAGVGLGWLPALSAPSMIVNWISLPTAVGEIVFKIIGVVVDDLALQPFINVTRLLGLVLLLAIGTRQWWAARDGGPDAIRRAGIVLLAAAILSPATLPWYPSWGIALLAAAAWTTRRLAFVVFASLWLIIAYYPNGEEAMYNFPRLALWALVFGLAAVALLRPDPLHLGPARAESRVG